MAQQERPNCKTCPGKDGLFEGKAFWLASDSWLWKIKSDVISEAPQALIVFSVWHSDTRPVRLSNISVSGCLYDFLIQSLSDCQTSQFLDACLTKKKCLHCLTSATSQFIGFTSHFDFGLHFDFEMFTSHCILKLIDHDLEDLVCADSFLAVLLSVPANSCLVRLVQSSECPELSQTKYNPCQLLDPERGLVKMFCY